MDESIKKPKKKSSVQKVNDQYVWTFFDGEKDRTIDVFALYMKFIDELDEIQRNMVMAETILKSPSETKDQEMSKIKQSMKCTSEAVDKMYKVFNIKPFEMTENGRIGLTVSEVLGLTEELSVFISTEKKYICMSDLAEFYGTHVLTLPPEIQFGLLTNINREVNRRSRTTSIGIGAAIQPDQIDDSYWLDFMSEAQLEYQKTQINLVNKLGALK